MLCKQRKIIKSHLILINIGHERMNVFPSTGSPGLYRINGHKMDCYFARRSGCKILWWVRLCVCLSSRISLEPHTIITNFFLPVAYGHGLVLPLTWWWNSKGRGSFGVFFSIDHVLCSIAFGTNTKMAEPIEMPFGMMNGLGPRNSVLGGGDELMCTALDWCTVTFGTPEGLGQGGHLLSASLVYETLRSKHPASAPA